MPDSRLDEIQRSVLETLGSAVSGWTLSGGAALAGFHLGHRSTRDLDLFWHGRSSLDRIGEEVRHELESREFRVTVLQAAPAFVRLLVERKGQTTTLDLVAEPIPPIDMPGSESIGTIQIRVDTAQEILVNKLCALLHRSESRDLLDVLALLEHGADLRRALTDAPRKENGFSPLTLMWVLREMPLQSMARGSGAGVREGRQLERMRDELVQRIARLSGPPA
jgi:predicted nucleotidyltransferase component of viral defense system